MTLRTHLGRLALTGGLTLVAGSVLVLPASAETEVDRPDSFTSAFTVNATPDAVINPEGESAPGEDGTSGTFTFMINSDEEIICYDITTRGVTPPYQSKAKTATHVHQAVAGKNGPPRLSFPNPEGDGEERTSSGCLQGPFTTGLEGEDGNDTGEGFSLKSIESDPSGFSADTHTSAYVPGAVRGQLTEMPVGGVETGLGGASADSSPAAAGLAAGLLLAVGAGAVVVRRRARASL